MMRFFKKSTCMVVVIAIIMSVCAVCFGAFGSVSAAENKSHYDQDDTILYDFNNGTGVTHIRAGQVSYVDGQNGNKYVSAGMQGSAGNQWHAIRLGKTPNETLTTQANTSTSYRIAAGEKYKVTLKIAFPAGSEVTSPTFTLQVLLCTSSAGAKAETGSVTLNYSDFGFVKDGDKYKLAETTWAEKTFTFKNSSDNDNGCFYVRISSPATVVYYDDIKVEVDNKVRITFNTNGGTLTGGNTMDVVKNAPADMPIPSFDDMAFGGWYTDPSFAESTKVGATYQTDKDVTLYAKWTHTKAMITFNNCGVEETKIVEPGLELSRPQSPDSRLFFEGWYTDTTFTTRVTTAEVGTYTLYAKYNGTYINFNNKGWADKSADVSLVADPDDAENNVLKFKLADSGRTNFALPAYDAALADFFELKTNTEYFYSFKYKVGAGSNAVNMQLNMGDRSAYDPNRYTRSLIPGGDWAVSANESDTNGDWITVTGTFTTGDTFYLERVKWSYQNHFFLNMYHGGNGKNTTVYFDEFIIGTKLTEKPEGTTAIYFETNSTQVDPLYGYEGEEFTLPADPTGVGLKFLGWYTDIYLTKPFNGDTTFPAKDLTLYAKWEAAPIVIDFEHYDAGIIPGRAKYITDEKGNHLFDIKTEYKPETSLTTLYRLNLNDKGVKYTVVEGETYTVSFEYKLTRGQILYGIVTHSPNSAWSNSYEKRCGQDSEANGKWKTATFTFTAVNEKGYDKGTWEAFTLGIGGDLDCYIDNVTISSANSTANVYGDSIIKFNSNGGSEVAIVSGNDGDKIPELPTPKRAGYTFAGWYTDAELTTKFAATNFTEGEMTLYASWILGKFVESFEEFPAAVVATGISGGYKLYNSEKIIVGFDAANVKEGDTSLFRDGTKTGAKAFTLCREDTLALAKGKQYTVSFYVKPSNVTDAAGTISLIGMSKSTGIAAPENTTVIKTVGDLKAGEWQKVSYTFTADSPYIGISTTAGNDLYLDGFTISLKGYTGSTTGDSSVSPIIITLMAILAAGALVITGKKVFGK